MMEAAALLALVSIGLRLFRFSNLRRVLGSVARWRLEADADTPRGVARVDRIVWAVTAVSARLSLKNCFARALSADVMLRRRGCASEVRFGVHGNRELHEVLSAHAWVECEGKIVIGEADDLSEYAVLSAPRHS